ncbi:MAG: helix-turn-helix transcriptional regulator [Prolixibacteraceae bacterium]|nr:helix-turn-helix transcriptional regulator [Prolixibacteraceae bacterium]
MKDRIIKLIESEGLTASEFADRVGVQRSNISHVLSGRNQPGFTFIQKILETFTNLNSRWLITGQGEMYEKSEMNEHVEPTGSNLFSRDNDELEENRSVKDEIVENKSDKLDDVDVLKEEIEQKEPENKDVEQKSEYTERTSQMKKSISKVLIFYENDTFKEYNPAE